MTRDLADAFLDALDQESSSAFADRAVLARALEAMYRAGQTAWPSVRVDQAPYGAHVARHAPTPRDPAAPLSGLRGADLYLACACARGQADGIAAFERAFADDLAAVARRFRRQDDEDVLQRVRTKILVRTETSPPKIADYAGLGFLQNWVRITAVRTFLDEARRKGASAEIADTDRLAEVAAADDDIELAFLKRHYRAEFKQAFRAAIDGLQSRQRNALRQHLVAGLTIDQLSKLYGVHRATAARRVADARAALLTGTRRALAQRLRIDKDELDSVMRLIHSQLDVSVVRLLGSRATAVGLGS